MRPINMMIIVIVAVVTGIHIHTFALTIVIMVATVVLMMMIQGGSLSIRYIRINARKTVITSHGSACYASSRTGKGRWDLSWGHVAPLPALFGSCPLMIMMIKCTSGNAAVVGTIAMERQLLRYVLLLLLLQHIVVLGR